VNMRLCKGTDCPRYPRKVRISKRGDIRVVKRSCYYEPGCPLGMLDLMLRRLKGGY